MKFSSFVKIVCFHLCVATALTNRFVRYNDVEEAAIESDAGHFVDEQDWRSHHKYLFDKFIKEKYRNLQKFYEAKNNETAELFARQSRRKARKSATQRDDDTTLVNFHPLKFFDNHQQPDEAGYKRVKLFTPSRQFDTAYQTEPTNSASGHQFAQHGYGLVPHPNFLDPLFLIATLSFIAFLINNILGLIDRIRLPNVVRARNGFLEGDGEDVLDNVSNYLERAIDEYEDHQEENRI
jgi:hypothetical protein